MCIRDRATLEYIPTIPKFLEFIKKQYSDYPAISDKVTTYTYEELVSRVAKRVTFINSLGLEKGSNIAVLAKNDLDAMELFLAIPAAGHVLIMLPNALNDKALAGISMKFDLAGMFVGKEFTEVTANPVSYTHLDVYKRQGCKNIFNELKRQRS